MQDQRNPFPPFHGRDRLIAAIAFTPQLLWVKAVLTHADYDEGDWK